MSDQEELEDRADRLIEVLERLFATQGGPLMAKQRGILRTAIVDLIKAAATPPETP